MRKYLIFLFILFPAILGAAPWGAMVDYMDLRGEEKPSQVPGDRYLLSRVLAGRPIHAFLGASADNPEKYKKIVQNNYNRWFFEPAQYIRNAKREAEFADVLPLLDRGMSIIWVDSADKAEVEFLFVSLEETWEECGEDTLGCHRNWSQENKRSIIFIMADELRMDGVDLGKGNISAEGVSLHEMGHSLGISDQYSGARGMTSHPIYHGPVHQNSIMLMPQDKLSCDDVDGILNLIDITRGTSRTRTKGWSSFCQRDTVYVGGTVASASSKYRLSVVGEYKAISLETYQSGQRKSVKEFLLAQKGYSPFVSIKETVVETDNFGRPLYARGANGEEIYYSYTYENKRKVTLLNGKVMRFEEYFLQVLDDNTEYMTHMVYFGTGGLLSQSGAIYHTPRNDQEGIVFYDKNMLDGEEVPDIIFWFDKEGEISDQLILEEAAEQEGKNALSGQLVQRLRSQILPQELKSWYFKH